MKNRITKLLALLFAVIMTLSCFTLVADAAIKEKYAVGSIVYLRYSETAPNMEAGVIDDTWGEKLIHLTKDSFNSGLYVNKFDYKDNAKPEEDTYTDIWATFDGEKMYFAFFTNDLTPLGSKTGGDSVCLMFEPYNTSLTYICEADPDTAYLHTYHTVGSVLSEDDFTPYDFGENEERQLTWVEKNGGFYIKFTVSIDFFGLKEKDIEEGTMLNFNFMRNILTQPENFASGDGLLYWGKWFTKFPNKGSYYVFDCDKAKGPNTMILLKTNTKNVVGTKLLTDEEYALEMGIEKSEVPQETDADTEIIAEQEKPSAWAFEEVSAAIGEGLVPVSNRRNYSSGITRGQLASLLSALLDKVYDVAPAKTDAKFTDTTDKDVLRAANLGIITGYEDGTFKPEKILKRSEMSVIINRVAKLCGVAVEGFDGEVKFTDTATHWCKGELGWPVHAGIVKGTSETEFSPENTLTVEQTIMMIYRTFEALK